MINAHQAQTLMVEVCQKVITNLADQHKVALTDMNMRIDMENTHATPVFSLFDKSAFICKCSLNEVINAGGGKGFAMLISMEVRKVIADLFKDALQRHELTDAKQLFLLMYVQPKENVPVPTIAIYKQGEEMESAPIAHLIGVAND